MAAWGSDAWGLTWVPDDLTDVVSAAAGETSFAVAVNRDGKMTAWGNNHVGEGDVSRWSHLWVEKVAAGFTNGIALAGSSGPVVWGTYGRATAFDLMPRVQRAVIDVAAGGEHALALQIDGKVVAWGNPRNVAGQLDVPPDLEDVVAIDAAGFYSVALKSDGTVMSWGAATRPEEPANLTGIAAISAGTEQCLALTTGGKVIAWGSQADSLPADLRN